MPAGGAVGHPSLRLADVPDAPGDLLAGPPGRCDELREPLVGEPEGRRRDGEGGHRTIGAEDWRCHATQFDVHVTEVDGVATSAELLQVTSYKPVQRGVFPAGQQVRIHLPADGVAILPGNS